MVDIAKRAEVSIDSVRRVRGDDAVTHTDDRARLRWSSAFPLRSAA